MQVLVAWERLLHHAGTRAALMAEAAILEAVAAAVGHRNAAVRAAARACVGLVVEVDRLRQEQEQGLTESGSTGGELSVWSREEREEDDATKPNQPHKCTYRSRRAPVPPAVRGAQPGVAGGPGSGGGAGGGRRTGLRSGRRNSVEIGHRKVKAHKSKSITKRKASSSRLVWFRVLILSSVCRSVPTRPTPRACRLAGSWKRTRHPFLCDEPWHTPAHPSVRCSGASSLVSLPQSQFRASPVSPPIP